MKKKYEFLNIHLFELGTLATHFEEMAAQGWMLDNIGATRAMYIKCEPQVVHFYIDIYHKGKFLNPQLITKEEEMYGDFISEYGYELITRTTNYQVFMSKCKDVLPIHEQSTEIKKKDFNVIMKYEFLNYLLVPLFMIPFLLWQVSWQLSDYTLRPFTQNTFVSILCIIPLLLLAFILRIAPCCLWLIKKDKYHISPQQLIQRSKRYYISIILLFTFWTMMVLLGNMSNMFIYLLVLLGCSFIFFLIDPLVARFIKKYHSIVAIIICVFLSVILSLNFIMPINLHHTPTNTNAFFSYELIQNDVGKPFNREVDYDESVLCKLESVYEDYKDTQLQSSKDDNDIFSHYNLYTIKMTFLIDFMQNRIFKEKSIDLQGDLQLSQDNWKLYKNEHAQILIWDNYILDINLESTLTIQQISTILDTVKTKI